MNIGIDARCLMEKNRTGVGEYAYGLLDALFEIDKDNHFFLFYNSWKNVHNRVELWKQDNVHYVAMRWPNKILNLCIQLLHWPKLDKKIIQNSEFRIQNLDFWFSPNLHFTALLPKTKHILTIHDLSFEYFPHFFSWKRRIWHWILQPKKQCERAVLVLTPSSNTRRDVISKFKIKEKKVKILQPGIERFQISDLEFQNEVKQKYNLPNKFILFLGTIEPRKNIVGLVEAFKKSNLFVDDWSLIVAGGKGWKCDDILQLIEETEGVRYIDYIDAKDKQALYELASLFAYPSFYEGFGFPVLEALACGTPVITSSRSSLPEIAGEWAHLVDPYNVDEIARAMKQVLQSERKIKTQEIFDKFNWQNTARVFSLIKYENRNRCSDAW